MIRDFLIAVGNYKKYGELVKRNGFHAVGYAAVLLLVCSIGLILVPLLTVGAGAINVFMEDIPSFTITENGLNIQNDFDFELSGVKIAATNNREFSDEDFGYNISGMLFDKDTVIIRNFNKTQSFSYNEFGSGYTVTKDDLYTLKPYLYLCGLLMFVMLYLATGISFAFDAVLVGLIASVISPVMGIHIPTGKHILLAVYAHTTPYILAAVFTVLRINVPGIIMNALAVAVLVLFFKNLKLEATKAFEEGRVTPPDDIVS